ncbi:MAG: hypothetical protein Q9187_006887 [Circinaria calcarea]
MSFSRTATSTKQHLWVLEFLALGSEMAMTASAALKARVWRPSYLKKLAKTEEMIGLFPHGAYVGWSGFTSVGYPKKVPPAFADHMEKTTFKES